jgi:hypothetical protein
MRIALLLLAPWGFQCPAYTDDFVDDVAVVRDEWRASALPADTCGNPTVSVQSLAGVYGYQHENDIVIDRDLSDIDARATARHETVHWLAWCTRYQASGDAGHADPLLWDDGLLGRVEDSP